MKKYEKIIYLLLSFMIPIFIMMILFHLKGGLDVEQLAIGDMQAQHIDMLLLFKKILTGEESMFYSIINGLGGNVYSSMAYYMLSPINLIILFFEDAKIMYAIRLIILIKIGLSGLTMYLLLNSKYNNKKMYSLLFSLCYALMAFVVDNYFCTLWLDAVYLAPLIIIGIDRLINKNSVILYMITLSLCIFSNFYMGYMICIFCVIYFVYSLVLKYNKNDKKLIINTSIRFLISSLLSGLSVAVIYIPSIVSILNSDRTVIEANETTVFNVIYRMFLGSYSLDDFLSYYHPCIYCGLIVIPLLIIFFFNKKIKEKEKFATFLVILVFVFSILFYQLSYIWHGFSYPIGYNFRFSFLLDLFVILIAHRQLCNMPKSKPSKSLKYVLFSIILLSLVFVFKIYSNINGYISVILLSIYSFALLKQNKKIQYILLSLVIIEIGYNTYATYYVNNDHFTTRETLENDICQNIYDSDNYRVAGYEYYGTNENVACSFSGTRLFSTTINSNITNFYSKVGFMGGINMYSDNLKNTPIIYSLLGVKYFYSNEQLNNYKLIKEFEVKKSNNYYNEAYIETNYIYENEYVLNLGYMVKDYSINSDYDNFFEFQNDLIKKFSGINDNVLIRLSDNNDEKIIDSKYIYMFIYSDVASVVINDTEYGELPQGEVLAFQNNYNTTKFDIKAFDENGNLLDYDAYYLDLSVYLTAINNLKNNQLENININKNIITGNIQVKEAGTLALSIPYEAGFTLYVDGKKSTFTSLYDFFIGINLSDGYHEIELVYVPRFFNISIIISIVSLLLSIIFIFLNETKKGKKIYQNIMKIGGLNE